MNPILNFDFFEKESRILTIIIPTVVILLFCDNYLSSSLDVMSDIIKNPLGLVLFTMILLTSIVISFFFMEIILGIVQGKKSLFSKYRKAFKITQMVLYGLSIVLLFDILSDHRYFTFILNLIVTISYGSSISMSIIATIKFFTWYRTNRNKFVILFGLTLFFIFANSLISLFLFNSLLIEKPLEYSMLTPNVFAFECEENSLNCILKENLLLLQNYSLVIYFILFWGCTILLLHHHINKIGKVKFFALVSIPIILFYFQFVYTYEEFFTISEELKFDANVAFAFQLFLATLLTALCSILFGIGFFSVARLLKKSTKIEKFLFITGFGVITYFITANATLASAGMPPFGIPNIIFLPVSSMLMYIGIFYSMTSIANDIAIKKFIKNSTFKELKLIGNLAENQMLDEMKSRVLRMTQAFSKEIEQKNESELTNSPEEFKKYMSDVINIYKKQKGMDF